MVTNLLIHLSGEHAESLRCLLQPQPHFYVKGSFEKALKSLPLKPCELKRSKGVFASDSNTRRKKQVNQGSFQQLSECP